MQAQRLCCGTTYCSCCTQSGGLPAGPTSSLWRLRRLLLLPLLQQMGPALALRWLLLLGQLGSWIRV